MRTYFQNGHGQLSHIKCRMSGSGGRGASLRHESTDLYKTGRKLHYRARDLFSWPARPSLALLHPSDSAFCRCVAKTQWPYEMTLRFISPFSS